MAKPLTLPPLSNIQVTKLRHLYETVAHPKLRRRAQMILLAHQGRAVAEIAAMVYRSRDTVERVLKRFLQGGVTARPPRKAPGMAPSVTPEWKAALLRVLDLDPHTVGVPSANWTTNFLAVYLRPRPALPSLPRRCACVFAGGGLCLPAPHVDSQTPSRGATGLRGKRLRVEVFLAGAGTPPPPPVPALVEPDLLAEVPPDLEDLLHLLSRADVSLQDEVQCAFPPTLTRVWCRKGRRGQRLVEAPGANEQVYGFGLVDWCEGWFDGRRAPGRTADVFCAQGRAAGARSRAQGHMALVIVDNLRTHTPAGSKLVRQMRAELHDSLRIIYTPAYDPDANRIEWLWRWSRREVTHNHQRATFTALLEAIHVHCHTLAQHPDLILRQIGSPFAAQEVNTQELANAA